LRSAIDISVCPFSADQCRVPDEVHPRLFGPIPIREKRNKFMRPNPDVLKPKDARAISSAGFKLARA